MKKLTIILIFGLFTSFGFSAEQPGAPDAEEVTIEQAFTEFPLITLLFEIKKALDQPGVSVLKFANTVVQQNDLLQNALRNVPNETKEWYNNFFELIASLARYDKDPSDDYFKEMVTTFQKLQDRRARVISLIEDLMRG